MKHSILTKIKKKIEKYINNNPYLFRKRLLFIDFIHNRQLDKKLKYLFGRLIDVIFTGIILHYAIHHNNFFSYGLVSALFMYYFRWIVKTIKE